MKTLITLTLLVICCAAPLIHPSPTVAADSSSIDKLTVTFKRYSVSFLVDLTVHGQAGQDIFVGVWFRYSANDELIGADGWNDDYESANGSLVTSTTVNAIYETSVWSLADGNPIELEIPYNLFPTVDYNYLYYPQVEVRNLATSETLASVAFQDTVLRVKGEGEPNSYRVWMNIHNLYIADGTEDCCPPVSSGSDEFYTVYTLSHYETDGLTTTATNGWGPYDVWAGEVYEENYFDPVIIDIPATGNGVFLTIDLIEADDVEQAKQIIGVANQVIGGADLLGVVLKVNPTTAGALAVLSAVGLIADITVNYLINDYIIGQIQVIHGLDDLERIALSDYSSHINNYDFTGTDFLDSYTYNLHYILYVNVGYDHELVNPQ